MQVQIPINTASAYFGNDARLAAALDVSRASVCDWRKANKIPERYVLKLLVEYPGQFGFEIRETKAAA